MSGGRKRVAFKFANFLFFIAAVATAALGLWATVSSGLRAHFERILSVLANRERTSARRSQLGPPVRLVARPRCRFERRFRPSTILDKKHNEYTADGELFCRSQLGSPADASLVPKRKCHETERNTLARTTSRTDYSAIITSSGPLGVQEGSDFRRPFRPAASPPGSARKYTERRAPSALKTCRPTERNGVGLSRLRLLARGPAAVPGH